MEDDTCQVLDELLADPPANTKSNREGLLVLLEHIAEAGLAGLPSSLCHIVDYDNDIYELIKGSKRLFFFRGQGKRVVICTSLATKKSQKADPKHVRKAVRLKGSYAEACKNNSLEVLTNEDE